jgi:hypothetical protein
MATVGEGLAPPEQNRKYDKRKIAMIYIHHSNLFLQKFKNT